VYIFRPDPNNPDAEAYTQLVSSEMIGTDTFNFKMSKNDDRYAQLKISIDPDLQVLKAVVELDSLPELHHNGYEVVVQFNIDDFDQKNIFYTDSNGLKMQ
jgi:hypothetical protein